MNAITVCVNYSDLLKITLPRNRRHFNDYLIVTSHDDLETVRVAAKNNCSCFQTNAFYLHGAMFNKGLAMEQGFDVLGREGQICILDADIVLPQYATFDIEIGKLYSPYRFMLDKVEDYNDELEWGRLPTRQDFEHCGYCTYFDTRDPHLSKPWYGLNWSHAGGCDSEFQSKWPLVDRYRPEWKVLHLGPTDTNWCGRVSGLEGAEVEKRRNQMYQVLHSYRRPELNIPMDDIHKVNHG